MDSKQDRKSNYISERARSAYTAAVCRPDLTYEFAKLAHYPDPTNVEFKKLRNIVKTCCQSPNKGLMFVPLDKLKIFISPFIDAEFATNKDLTSQLGFIMMLMDKELNGNIIHYGGMKSKSVTRIALAAELFALTYVFDVCSTICLSLNNMFEKKLDFDIYTDSRSLFDCITNINRTTEKRLLIDLCILQESYERREISEVFWIPTNQNPADTLTKFHPCKAPEKLMKSNKVIVTPNAWFERSKPS